MKWVALALVYTNLITVGLLFNKPDELSAALDSINIRLEYNLYRTHTLAGNEGKAITAKGALWDDCASFDFNTAKYYKDGEFSKSLNEAVYICTLGIKSPI